MSTFFLSLTSGFSHGTSSNDFGAAILICDCVLSLVHDEGPLWATRQKNPRRKRPLPTRSAPPNSAPGCMKREAALHTAVNAILKKMVRLGEKIATLVFNLTIFYMGWVLAVFISY